MPTTTEKRPSYSFFEFPSLHYGQRVRVNSRAIETALIELETTPGVTGWRLVDQEVPFVSGGQERRAVLQLAVTRRAASRQLRQMVQLVNGSGGSTEQAALAAGREYCERHAMEHVPMAANRSSVGQHEVPNRRAAHAWLLQAQGCNTRLAEGRMVAAAQNGGLLLSEAAARLELTPLHARLVFIRCWLRGLLLWDIGSEPISRDLLVRAARHV